MSYVKEIFRVIYAPHKAFREIIKNPKYIGPILILILFSVAQLGVLYNFIAHSYVEQTLPEGEQLDVWTQNADLWTAEMETTIDNNYEEFINGTYYGNSSLEISSLNNTHVSIELENIGPVNCYGEDGYKKPCLSPNS